MSFGIFVLFQKTKLEYLCLSNFINPHKCKYELFHLNMLRLFQEITKRANILMQKVST
jgi:hypothetical protein